MKTTVFNQKWIWLILSLIVLIPVFIYACISMPAADDYSNANVIKEGLLQGYNYFGRSVKGAITLYWTTSGYLCTAFFNYFFSPLLRGGIMGIRIFNSLSTVFFYASLFLFITFFNKYYLKSGGTLTWILFFIAVFAINNNYSNHEIYTWFCVKVGYFFPMAWVFLLCSLFIYGTACEKRIPVIISVILAFPCSLFNLNVTALNCGMTLLLGVYSFLILKKKRTGIIIFAFSMMGAMINVISPGNYLRHDSVSTSYNVLGCVMTTFHRVLFEMWKRATLSYMIPEVILAFIFIYKLLDISKHCIKIRTIYLFIGALVVFLGISIVDFPVIMGYGGLPDRCVFVQDVTATILIGMWIILFVGWLKTHFPVINIKDKLIYCICIICVVLVMIMWIHGGSLSTVRMISALSDGSLKECIDQEKGIIEEIESLEECIVDITRPSRKEDPYLFGMGLTDDPEFWINASVGDFYNVKSVRLRFLDE